MVADGLRNNDEPEAKVPGEDEPLAGGDAAPADDAHRDVEPMPETQPAADVTADPEPVEEPSPEGSAAGEQVAGEPDVGDQPAESASEGSASDDVPSDGERPDNQAGAVEMTGSVDADAADASDRAGEGDVAAAEAEEAESVTAKADLSTGGSVGERRRRTAGDEIIDASGGLVAEAAADEPAADEPQMQWYILKVQVNREDSIRDALMRRIKIEGLEEYFGDVVVPVEELVEFNKSGKRRIVKRKLYPGYILVNMVINDDTWFVVRETPGVGDFTGSAGKPTPMDPREVERILRLGADQAEGAAPIKTAIPFRSGDRVRVKDGNFQNFEGEVDTIDEANGRIVVIINIFNRSTPVELEHWQVEAV